MGAQYNPLMKGASEHSIKVDAKWHQIGWNRGSNLSSLYYKGMKGFFSGYLGTSICQLARNERRNANNQNVRRNDDEVSRFDYDFTKVLGR